MNLATVEIKAFVPARDFELSKRFYRDLGFEIPWSSDDLAYLHAGDSSFLLQKFYNREHARNFMMHLLVRDVEAWWQHVVAQKLVERYGVAADVAIHAPHREGDQRNHHAHILTTTRVLSAEGLTDKTRATTSPSCAELLPDVSGVHDPSIRGDLAVIEATHSIPKDLTARSVNAPSS